MPQRLRLALLSFLITCCLVAPVLAGPRILFDESHGQRFLAGGSGPLDLSGLAELLRRDGYEVAGVSEALSASSLAGVDLLVISGAFKPLSADELGAVLDYVAAGGGLLVTLHIAPPLRDLLHRLDVDFTNGSLRESSNIIKGNPLDFSVAVTGAHPATRGLTSFSVYGAWALRGTAPHVVPLAETGPRAWVDLNRDGRLSRGDAMQTFAVMAAGTLGRGRYLVVGDDALFQNSFLDEPNRRLARNLAAWLAPR